ncbi:hypothetical protein MNBD_GAMMA12-854 [hydrothermal vent metagenome]|uniref:Uncharacterized protein n=1 Tax=hydrothermal vent metagenome TaxID=652676 RepID=A0A3B0ZHG0_9ZZZZ
MKAPFILNENGDISLFKDMESLVCYLEPEDIRNCEYTVHDSDGYKLKLDIGRDSKNIQIVRVSERDDNKCCLDALKISLIEFLNSLDINTVSNAPTLDQLIIIIVQKLGYTT